MIGVLGDLHLGRSLYNKDLSPSIRSTMYRFHAVCSRYTVDCAVQLGDVFDRSTPSELHRKQVAQWFNEFERSKIPLYVLVGNHDASNEASTGSALSALKVSQWEYVRIIDRPIVLGIGKENLTSIFLPFPSPGIYKSFEQYEKEALGALRLASGRVDNKGGRVYVFSHLMVEGARYGNQDFVYRGSDYAVPQDIVNAEFTRVIAGHVHRGQSLDNNVEIVGSADRLRYDESQDAKYFLLVDGDRYQCVFNPAIRLREIKLDIGADRSLTNTIDVMRYLQAHKSFSGRHLKVTSVVDDSSGIDWLAVERELYGMGAVHVHIEPPTKRRRKISSRYVKEIRDNSVIAKKFIMRNVEGKADRQAAYRYFRRLYKRSVDKI